MGLIAHWPLDGNANDAIGIRHGTKGTGASWTTSGKIGSALSSVRTTNSHVLVPHDAEISKRIFGPESDNFSICFWYYPRTMPSYGTIVQKAVCGSWSCSTTGFWAHSTNKLRFIIGNNTSGNGSTDYKGIDATLTLNEWHFCVGSVKNNIMHLYVDNILIGTNNAGLITNRSETTSSIILGGARVSTYTDGLDGIVNDVRIYDHVLSTKEMQEIGKAKVLHYTFNQFVEPTTNLVVQHGQTGTNPFNGDGGAVNLGMVSTPSFRGRDVARHTTGTSQNFYINGGAEISTATSSTEWSSTFYIKREDGGAITAVGTYMYVNGNSNSNINGVIELVEDGWYKVTRTRTGLVSGYVTLAGCYGLGSIINYYIAAWQVEPKDHVTPFVDGSRDGTVRDMSGYGHDSLALTEATTPEWASNSRLGSGDYIFNKANETRIRTNELALYDKTISFWAKVTTGQHTSAEAVPFMVYNDGTISAAGDTNQILLCMQTNKFRMHGWGSGDPICTTDINDGEWHHLVWQMKYHATDTAQHLMNM